MIQVELNNCSQIEIYYQVLIRYFKTLKKHIDSLIEELCPQCKFTNVQSLYNEFLYELDLRVDQEFISVLKCLGMYFFISQEVIISKMKGFIDQANEIIQQQIQIQDDDPFDRQSQINKDFSFKKLADESLGAYVRSLENGYNEIQNEKEKYIEELLNAKKKDEKLLKRQIIQSMFKICFLQIQLNNLQMQSEQTIAQQNFEIEKQNKNITFLNETIKTERNALKVYILRHIKC